MKAIIRQAIAKTKIHQHRVKRWLGKPCNCPGYKIKRQELEDWAKLTLAGKSANPTEELEEILS